jgi:hypothetical protein
MALGAQPAHVVRLVLGSSATALLAGIVGGTAAAGGISAILVHVLPGIQPMHPVACLNVVLLLSAAVVLPVPSRRGAPLKSIQYAPCAGNRG